MPQAVTRQTGDNLYNCHEKLGHSSRDKLLKCVETSHGEPQFATEDVGNIICKPCIQAETKRAKMQTIESTAIINPELTHNDLSRSITSPSLQVSWYVQVLIDNRSRAGAIFVLSKNKQIFQTTRWYKARVENGVTPKRLYGVHLNGAGEYRSDKFVTFAMENGIILEFTPPYAN